MKIAIDAMGGDKAPKAIIQGVIDAQKEVTEDCIFVLVGPKDTIAQTLQELGHDGERMEIVDAPELIGMDEHPTKAISTKQKSGIVVGYSLLKQKAVDAFCSAGNTGAMLVGAMFTIKAIEGVIRPGIAGFFPKLDGRYGIVVDVGANADCKADVLNQFAELGSVYYQHIFDVPKPKIGLLNLGEEEKKGTLLTQSAFQLLKINNKINFIGNIEGSDVFTDKADVIIADGFTGNVILKMGESFYEVLSKMGVDNTFLNMFNYESVGGSPILGVNGNVIIGHGKSSSTAIKNMLKLAVQTVDSKITEKLKQAYS